jgi:hypothetical protein
MKVILRGFSPPLYLRHFFSFLLVLLASFSLSAQNWYFGKNRKYMMPIQYLAPMQVSMKEDVLERPLNAPADLHNYDFLNTIGGVAFQSIAQPSADFPPGKFSLFYNAKKMDGQRLNVIMGKDTLTASLYDWQLIPLVEYSNSEFQSCVSLFGPQSTEHAYHIVYHRAFKNTLLGVRLLNSDIMLIDLSEFWKLPSFENTLILGAGETDTPEWQARQAAISLESALTTTQFQSYVLTDYGEDVRIGRVGKALTLTGAPYYHFWKSDFAAYQEKREKKGNEINALVIRANALADSINSNRNLSYQDRIKLNDQRNELIMQHNEKVKEADALRPEVVVLDDLIGRMKAQRSNLEQFNPAVYNAARNTMQFSAFFRYAKQQNSTNWSLFVASVKNVPVSPVVKTPVSWDKP